MMKRCVGVCLALLLMLTTVLPVSATSPVTFAVTANDAEAGETVTVAVTATKNSYFCNGIMYIHYDPAVLTYVADSCMRGAASPASVMVIAADHPDKSYVKVAYVTTSKVTKEGDVVVMEFTAKNNALSTLSVSFEECCGDRGDGNEYNLDYTTTSCTINSSSGVTVPPTTTTARPITSLPTASTTVSGAVTTPTTLSSAPTDATAPTSPVGTTTTVIGGVTETTVPTSGSATAEGTTSTVGGTDTPSTTYPMGETIPVGAVTTTVTTSVSLPTDGEMDVDGVDVIETPDDDKVSSNVLLWLFIGVVVLTAAAVTVLLLLLKKKKKNTPS